VCKSHSSDRSLIQCFRCNPVSVKLLCVPCRHSEECRFLPPPPSPKSEQEAGWEPELAWALWSTEKSLLLPGVKLWCLSCQTCGLLNISNVLSQQWYLHPLKAVGCSLQLILELTGPNHLWTYLHLNVRNIFSVMNVLVQLLYRLRQGFLTLFCAMDPFESGETYWPLLTKMYLNT